MRLTLKEIKDKITKLVPRGIKYEVDLEAASIAIITKEPARFQEDGLTGRISKEIKRRVEIRPDPSLLLSIEDSTDAIRNIIPSDALVQNIWFDPAISEVVIECRDPGVGVGKRGAHLKKLRDEIGWSARIERAPPIASRTARDINRFRLDNADERKQILRRFGTNVYRPKRPGQDWVRLTALGSYREVGRAMHLVTTNESRVLVDCGAKPGKESEWMPYFDAPEVLPPDKLDAVVITHAHIDHIGMLPVLFKYNYRGPVYCTPPTRDLMTMLQMDFIKVAQAEGRTPPYALEDIQEMMKHVIDVEWGQITDIAPDIKMTLHNAGHILGSSSVHMHIGDEMKHHNIVFSGDIKYEKSWLYEAAHVRFPRVETLVIESTYGGANSFQPSRLEATQELHDLLKRSLARGGKVFFPVFAVGRSQEVMIAIDQLFKSGECEPVTVWLDGMINEATAIHSSHPDYLNAELRKAVLKDDETNPFSSSWFRQVENREQREGVLRDPGSCIVLATSGMMTGGPIVEYLKNWAPESLNTLCFVGYQAEGTLGRKLQSGAASVPLNDDGRTTMVEMNCDMVIIDGFSGHSDRRQLMDYVGQINPKPRLIICHHGDERICAEFSRSIRDTYKVRCTAPRNLETLRLS